jgi:hypothetical protein
MFIRQKKNKSGSISVQIISKHNGKYAVEKSVGSSSTAQGVEVLLHQARHELSKIDKQSNLFPSQIDSSIEGFLKTLSNSNIQVIFQHALI